MCTFKKMGRGIRPIFFFITLLWLGACLTLIGGCTTSQGAKSLNDLKIDLESLQQDQQVKTYAANELKNAEDSLIAAINAWNAGHTVEADNLAKQARVKIQAIRDRTKAELALGLDKEDWEQMRYLQEIRAKRMRSSTKIP